MPPRSRTRSGLYALPHIAKGSHHIIMSGSFEPDRIFDVLEKHQHVTMFGAPTMVSRLINHRRAGSADTSGLRTLYFGGAPMYVSDLKKALEIFGPKLTQIYGQGESPDDDQLRLEAAARPAGPSAPRGDPRLAAACRAPASTCWWSTTTAASCPPARSAR